MRKTNLNILGYSGIEHGGYSWIGREEGLRFLVGVEDWSPSGLSGRRGWTSWKRQYHILYLATEPDGSKYLIKLYLPKKKGPFAGKPNRARREFLNTLRAHKRGIQTVLPMAVGTGIGRGQSNIIIYPFLDAAISLARIYSRPQQEILHVRERQVLEKSVGRLLRKFIDEGMFPRDLVLDHFLVKKEESGLTVHWVDLERVQFPWLFRKKRGVEALGRLLAHMEWLRISGWKINRSSMMRIGCAYFRQEFPGRMDKALCRLVTDAANRFWARRGLGMRTPRPVTMVQ